MFWAVLSTWAQGCSRCVRVLDCGKVGTPRDLLTLRGWMSVKVWCLGLVRSNSRVGKYACLSYHGGFLSCSERAKLIGVRLRPRYEGSREWSPLGGGIAWLTLFVQGTRVLMVGLRTASRRTTGNAAGRGE